MARTRERILDAAVTELDVAHALTIPAVARRAQTSIRTVYHHFANKGELIEGITERYRTRFGSAFDGTLEELPRIWAQRARRFGEDPALARAMSHIDPRVLAAARTQRLAVLGEILSPLLSGRSESERRRMTGAIYAMQGLYTWQTLHEYARLSPDDAAEAVEWMTSTLLGALAADRAPTNSAP